MRFSCYEWNPGRFHPSFSGIANRYSQQKKERLEKQKLRKELELDHTYTINLDHSLDKALESKTLELFKLRQAKERHLEEIKEKQRFYEQRMQQLQSLRERNIKTRLESKKNRETARCELYSRKEHNRVKLKEHLSKMAAQLENLVEQKLTQNNMKKRELREEEMMGTMKVNNFYRQKNEESLIQYLQRIKQENKLKKAEQKQIKAFQRQIQTISKTVDIKKNILNQIQTEIYKMKTDVKELSSGTKIRNKKVKEQTEPSQEKPNTPAWKKSLKKLCNPEEQDEHS